MRPIDDAPLSPDQRCAEVAKLLAAGVLRLHTPAALPANSAPRPARENPAKSAAPGLEVPDETVLSVHNG